MTCFAEDAVYRPGNGVERVGRAAIRRELEPQFRGELGAMRFDEHDRLVDERSRKAVVRWICRHDLAHRKPTTLALTIQRVIVGAPRRPAGPAWPRRTASACGHRRIWARAPTASTFQIMHRDDSAGSVRSPGRSDTRQGAASCGGTRRARDRRSGETPPSTTPQPARRRSARRASLVAAAALLACGEDPGQGTVHDVIPGRPAAIAARVADLLGRMTLDEKIGQMTLVDRGYLEAESDIATYGLGGILSGGGSTPETNTAVGWADMIDGYQRAALTSRLGIPILYGVDAVHGHGNLHGATLFPHNIGLGATRDPRLVQEIARATAEELAGTGVRWNFAPSVAVARDEHSGRTYESFGEVPEIAESFGTYVTGLQGAALGAGPASVLATAKHWIADGGTLGGGQYGDARVTDAELRAIHLPPFLAAMRAGAGAIMVAHSSVDGTPMHAHRRLVTDVLKGELGFRGLVVSDWAGTGDVSDDYPLAVRSVVNAGIDMVMVPYDYRTFIATLREEVSAGRVPLSRIDDAVTRILSRKVELGLFERPFADRSFTAGVGSPAHRELARRAVRASLVLLKNDGDLLPLAKSTPRIFVAGKSADDVGNQAGGWTVEWQGRSGDVVPGTTILQAIRATVAPGTTVTHGRHGSGIDRSYDVAVVVIGETPYAEWFGDRTDSLGLDAEDLETLAAVKRSGVPTVVILVSGRPLVVTDQLPDWTAFIAAWLPGSEGQGVADVLFGDHAPTGKLPLSWPRSGAQIPINVGDPSYDPLFPYGFGLTYRPPSRRLQAAAVAAGPPLHGQEQGWSETLERLAERLAAR